LLSDLPALEKGQDLMIIQHPDGEHASLGLGRFIDMDGEGRRLRYDANTLSGSSGSPVLDTHGKVIGIHHAGDPATTMVAFNQAIPINLVRAHIEAQLPNVLGA